VDRREVLIDERDRREALEGEVRETHPMHLVDLERDEAKGVAVGRGGRDRRMADHARAAGAVDDVHRLLEIALEHHGDLTRDRVGAAARGPRHDQRDRAFGERGAYALGGDEDTQRRQQGDGQTPEVANHFRVSPV
jgi:hypothetical protein